MKIVILAGGLGTRLGEETVTKPKPMVEIGGKPILWHIMKTYSIYGFNEFVICCGYKGSMIKEYFIHYHSHNSDCTYNLQQDSVFTKKNELEPWKVTLVNTGLHTLTAGRILRIKEYVGQERFMLTYGDGVADINLNALLEEHEQSKKTVTISITQPSGRFGAVKVKNDNTVESFAEKARKDQAWVNMGFMVCEPKVFDYLGNGSEMLEAEPFEKMIEDGVMSAYRHYGFWSPMDNICDKSYLEELWRKQIAPWKIW